MALMLIPLFLLVAFAVDLNHLRRADAELQNAADAAALAGTTRLLALSMKATQPNLSSAVQANLRSEARTKAIETATAFVQLHQAGNTTAVYQGISLSR